MATTQFVARNGLIALSDSTISGSLFVSQSVTATSFTGAFSGSVFGYVANSQTSSFVTNNQTGSFATTGSNIFIGNQTVTGSLFTSGSNTLIGTTTLSGSFNLSGSTLQQGNNTLIGNTVLSGSIGISGSSTIQGITTMTGSLLITGSTTQTGNNTLQGNTILSGSITISGSYPVGSYSSSVNIYGDTSMTGYLKFNPQSTNIDTTVSASYIYVSGSTNDLYFSQNGSGYSNVTRLRWLEGNLYTGLLNGGLITTQSSTIYQVSSGSGIIVSLNASLVNNPFPTIQYLNWPNLSASIAPLSASYDQQFIGVQSNGTIFAQGVPFTDGQYDTLIPIGLVLHQNHSTINGVKTQPSLAYGWKQRFNIVIQAFGPLKLSGFTVAVSGSSTGSLVVSSGTAFSDGTNYAIDPNSPSYAVDNGTTVSKILRYYQSGSDWVYNTNNGAGYPNLDPVYYNPGGLGVLDTVGTSNYSLQRVYWYPNSVTKAIVVYYGNDRYGTLALAQAALATEQFSEALNTKANAIYLGTYAIKGGTNTTLQNPNHFVWIPGGLFRGSGVGGGGGGGGATTLAGLSDVSLSSNTPGDLLVYGTGTTWNNKKQLTGSYGLTGSLNVTQNISASSFTGSLYGTASWADNAVSSSYPIAVTGSSLYSTNPAPPAGSGSSTTNGIFLGPGAGWAAFGAYNSNFIGQYAGYIATNANQSNFLGTGAGQLADSAKESNFIGYTAGSGATNALRSNFLGTSAGYGATSASNSTFMGYNAGLGADNASNSTLIGYKAGKTFSANNIGSNNIIIGNNISLPNAISNAINLGGVIYATDTSATTAFDPSITPANGKVGINVITPTYNFQVSGSVGFTDLINTVQANVVSIDTGTGQLYYQPAGTFATVDQINTPDAADVYVRPQELETSKHATINIFNYLNFS